MGVVFRFASHELTIRLIYRAQQFAERRRFLDRPYAVERWPERSEVVTGKQSDSYDAFLSQKKRSVPLTYVRKRS